VKPRKKPIMRSNLNLLVKSEVDVCQRSVYVEFKGVMGIFALSTLKLCGALGTAIIVCCGEGENMAKIKTVVTISKYVKRGEREHFRTITLDANPQGVWKALEFGCFRELNVSINQIRAKRKRKGGLFGVF